LAAKALAVLPVFKCAVPDCRIHALQVGASNELPESEELDALYDRFLVRREVSQVRTPDAAISFAVAQLRSHQ